MKEMDLDKQQLKETAIGLLKKMRVMPQCIEAFENGEVWKSTGVWPMDGILFTLDKEEKTLLEKIEKKLGCLIYHVIYSVFFMDNILEKHLAFLCLYPGDENKAKDVLFEEEIFQSQNGRSYKGYLCKGYVYNFSYPPDSESGYLAVRPANGGIARVI